MISTAEPQQRRVFFNRAELSAILGIYGKMVSAGIWRDYAMDALADRAVFSVFKRTSEAPLYQIEKIPALARRQGAFAVKTPQGLVLRRGHELASVLRIFDQKLIRLVEA